MDSPRYQVLEAIRDRLAAVLTPPAGILRIGYMAYQQIHSYPAVFITIGAGSTIARQQHVRPDHPRGAWEHHFIVRIAWVTRGSDAEPLEARALLIHDQILTAFAHDPTLGGLCFDVKTINTLGTDEGELALAGSLIGPFYQDLMVSLLVVP